MLVISKHDHSFICEATGDDVLWQRVRMVACDCRAVLLIQSYRRMLPVRRAFLRARAASVKIQAAERGRVARREYKELKRRNAAAIRLQAWTRGHQQRVRYLRVLRVTLVLQIAVRRYQLAKRVAAREAERKAREAALVKVAEAEAAQRAAKEAAAEEVRRKERASFATIKVCLPSSCRECYFYTD